MSSLWNLKTALLLVLLGIGLTGSLTACVFEEGGRGGGHEGHWR